jgi:uncharacterized membrane protein YsdA (DUF1294 family)
MGIPGFLKCFDRGCSLDERKTSKILQRDYEQRYTGEEFEFETMYAVLIAQIFIVMTYSAAMPFLYLTLPIFCFVMYWTEKYLFLRFHKNVPLYDTSTVVNAVKIIEWAVPLHVIMGLLMFTSPDFFEEIPIIPGESNFPLRFGRFFVEFIMIKDERFNTPSGEIYLILSSLIICLFAFDKISSKMRKHRIGLFSLLIYKITQKCFKLPEDKPLFSSDIYSEIPAEDLMNEYRHTLEAIKDMVTNA